MYPLDATQERPAPVPPRPEDVIRDAIVLKRKVSIAVYAAVTFDLPLYLILGYTWPQIAVEFAIGWIIAVLAIHFSFVQIFRLRRRTAYPGLLMVNLSDTAGPPEAAAEAIFTLEGLLETQSSFIALRYDTGLRVLASRGMTDAEAQWVLETHASPLETATENRYPIDILADAPGRRAFFVPIVALKQSIGVLYLAAAPGNLLADRNLLADIGTALGLSLDNLRQKEQLLQKEARLRSVVMGAPIVLFSVDTAGAMTFIQGKGIAGLNLSPENIIGRSVWEIWGNYPEIIQSFRRAFAGDSVTSLAAIQLAGQDMVFESPEPRGGRSRPRRARDDERRRHVGDGGARRPARDGDREPLPDGRPEGCSRPPRRLRADRRAQAVHRRALPGRRAGQVPGDRNLLADIGGALGLSLDNLRQKEQLLQKESRLRSVVMGAPIVLFAVDTAGRHHVHPGPGHRRAEPGPGKHHRPAGLGDLAELPGDHPELPPRLRRRFRDVAGGDSTGRPGHGVRVPPGAGARRAGPRHRRHLHRHGRHPAQAGRRRPARKRTRAGARCSAICRASPID